MVAGDVPLYGGLDTVHLDAGVLADAEARAARLWGPTSAGSPPVGPPTPTRRSRWRSAAPATRSWSAAPCTGRC
ncbi:hypothetical protein ACFQX8_00130 [Klenkia terrae]|uniref:hypothetical protein n=1 Tax=Klenkia terrae TaxID=1052259 RepID=UPI003610CEB8